MPGRRIQNKLPGKTIALILGSAFIVGVIAFAGLFPKYLRIAKIKKQNVEKQILLDRQEAFFPAYAMALDLSRIDVSFSQAVVEKKPIRRRNIAGMTAVFESLAAKTNMSLSGSTIDTGKLNFGTDFISVELTLAGSLSDFRQYLIELVELNFFKTIEQILISTDPDTGKKFMTKIQILVDQK